MAKGGASSGKYLISGTSGDDYIDGSTYDAALQARGLSINGNAGNDTIRGGSGADILNGGDGTDTIYGDLADLVGAGGTGKVVWDGGKGSDWLDVSGLPYDSGNGTWIELSFLPRANSYIRTNMYKDNDYSLSWHTTYDATYTNNVTGFENVRLGDGDDVLIMNAGSGNNILVGAGGNDYLSAGDGNDTIFGDGGDDMLMGGPGNDTLYGGAGSDMFLFTGRIAGEYSYETIKDFDADNSDGTHDQIWLWQGWTITWGEDSSGTLHGYLHDGSTTFADITFEGMTLAQAGTVEWHNVDPVTGMPVA